MDTDIEQAVMASKDVLNRDVRGLALSIVVQCYAIHGVRCRQDS